MATIIIHNNKNTSELYYDDDEKAWVRVTLYKNEVRPGKEDIKSYGISEEWKDHPLAYRITKDVWTVNWSAHGATDSESAHRYARLITRAAMEAEERNRESYWQIDHREGCESDLLMATTISPDMDLCGCTCADIDIAAHMLKVHVNKLTPYKFELWNYSGETGGPSTVGYIQRKKGTDYWRFAVEEYDLKDMVYSSGLFENVNLLVGTSYVQSVHPELEGFNAADHLIKGPID